MRLQFDGKEIYAAAGQSLLDLVKALGMDGNRLTERPIAAKIAGEVFNLSYIPVREQEQQEGGVMLGRSMVAAGGQIRLLRYTDPAGKDVYMRTVQFLLFLALRQLWPKARAKMNCTVGPTLYVEVLNEPTFDAELLKRHFQALVQADFPLVRRRISTADAIAQYTKEGQEDKARLLHWRTHDTFDQYVHGEFADYFYGELAPSSGYVSVWDILPEKNGFLFLYPDSIDPNKVGTYREMPKFMAVNMEGERWCELMECETVADLNELVRDGKLRELIRVNEALHEKRFAQIADMVCQRGARVVLLSGPSSSGKTTSANRLATQLRVHGKKPILMGMDDYFMDRDKVPVGPDGKCDLEHINIVDTALFGEHLRRLLMGESVELPKFNFLTGKREWSGRIMQMSRDTVFIIEGIHALNPVLVPEGLDMNLIFRVYVSALVPLNLDDHNRIPSNYLRLLRRMVRDSETRGTPISQTVEMWDSVRRGEERWIFPFQENADVIFNSSTLYELAILKKYVYTQLLEIDPEEDHFEQVRSVVKILNYVHSADVDDEIPPTSLVREFIGGNHFYKH